MKCVDEDAENCRNMYILNLDHMELTLKIKSEKKLRKKKAAFGIYLKKANMCVLVKCMCSRLVGNIFLQVQNAIERISAEQSLNK